MYGYFTAERQADRHQMLHKDNKDHTKVTSLAYTLPPNNDAKTCGDYQTRSRRFFYFARAPRCAPPWSLPLPRTRCMPRTCRPPTTALSKGRRVIFLPGSRTLTKPAVCPGTDVHRWGDAMDNPSLRPARLRAPKCSPRSWTTAGVHWGCWGWT